MTAAQLLIAWHAQEGAKVGWFGNQLSRRLLGHHFRRIG